MSTSQNGWPVYTTSADLTPLRWITGRVVPGPVHAVLDHLCRRFDAEVEPIAVGQSWGWAYRPIRGQTSGYSNHASGTAIDLNAPKHPLGRRGTFTPGQVETIHAILRDLDGAVRWGGDYTRRADEMHFEINTDPATLRRVADRLGDDMADYAKQLDRIERKLDALTTDLAEARKAIGLRVTREADEVPGEVAEELRKDPR